MTFKKGLYALSASAQYSVSASVTTILSVRYDDGAEGVVVRGTMGGGGGMSISDMVDAREHDVTATIAAYNGNSATVNVVGKVSYARLMA